MTSVSTVRPPSFASIVASSWSGFMTAPLMVRSTVILLLRKLPCEPALVRNWSTSEAGRVRLTVVFASNRTHFRFTIALPAAARLCWGVSVLDAAGPLIPAHAESNPIARTATRVRLMFLNEYAPGRTEMLHSGPIWVDAKREHQDLENRRRVARGADP